MRNLKKILAMVLALVMSLSLMATAGAAQFPDVDDSNPYKTAIDVLDELKVFQGFEDGSFKPTDTLNRAQAAVLVYRIATGDVENKYLDNYTYMQQSKFNDLDGYNWAKGYINYCQNAGIVVGTSATTFNPGAPVTGYQLMVMLLRTLGYGKAGEFTDPKGWELQTAAIAEREGILKNVTGGDFGAPAPRQMVAEILFRGLLHDTVAYSPLTPGGYTNSGETLGKKNLGLEDIKGVVMANEFADLEDDDTLADGKTRLDVDGKVYNLDIKSELTDIGEIRHAYVQNGTKVLTTLENLNDSTVNQPENGKGSKVSDLSKVNGDTQYFLNFGPVVQDESEWRIEYNVEFKDATQTGKTAEQVMAWFESDYGKLTEAGMKKVGDYEYTKAIKPGEEISAKDLKIIRGIFDYADGEYDQDAAEAGINHGVLGSVFAGANSQSSTNRNKNLAVEMTYSQFVRDYITNENNPLKESDNGEWLKTIDNNGDGVADYVFLTTFVMSTVTGYNAKTETYTVEYDADSNGKDRKVEDTIKKSAIVSDEEELARDAVILYTWIDGKCYVSYPEVDTKAIDKKGIDYKKQTITCGDTTYEWSGIDYEAYHYYHEVSEAVAEVNYDLYKDHFGYVRLYKEATKGFVLLTDGFYATDRRNDDTYKAQIWDENAKELADIDVVDPGFNTANKNWFINSSVDQFDSSYKDDEGTWGRLNSFEDVYRTANSNRVAGCTPEGNYVTNIAIYDQSGEMYTLGYVSNATNRYSYRTHELAMDKDHFSSIKTETLYCNDTNGVGHKNTPQRINTTNDTVYYYVTWDTDKHGIARAVDVVSWTGYKNTPDGIALDNKNDLAYAVTSAWEDPRTTDGTDTLPYEIAEIVVIESEVHAAPSVVFPVTLYQRLLGTNRVGGTGYGYDSENKAWGYNDFEGKITAQDVNVLSYGDEELAPVDIHDLLKFYQIDRNENMWEITKNFADYDIHAGYITTSYQTDYRNYVQVNAAERVADDAGVDYTFDLETPIFKIGYDKDAAARKDHLLLNGFQQISVTGDVSSTFSSDELYYATDWDLGDKVIYMNDKNDGYFVINVTKSAKALWDNPDTAASAVGYQLLNLWTSIVNDQGTPADRPVVTIDGQSYIANNDGTATVIELSNEVAKTEPVVTFAEVDKVVSGLNKVGDDYKVIAPAGDTAEKQTFVVLGTDGKYYTYIIEIGDKTDPAVPNHGLLTSKDLEKLIVKRETPVNGEERYTFNFNPAYTQVTVEDLMTKLIVRPGKDAQLDTSKGNGKGYEVISGEGGSVAENQSWLTVGKVTLYLKDANGTPYTVVANCTADQDSWTDADGAMSVATVKTQVGSGTAPATNNAGTVKVFLNWEYPGSPNNIEVKSDSNNGYTYKVPAGSSLMFVVEDKDWEDVVDGTWTVDPGRYNNTASGTWKDDGTHWNAVNVYANWTAFTVTFKTDEAKPAVKTTADLVKEALTAKDFQVTYKTDDATDSYADVLQLVKNEIKDTLGADAAALISEVASQTVFDSINAGDDDLVNTFKVTLTKADGSKEEVTVNSVRFVYLYTETALKTEVATKIAGITSAAAVNGETGATPEAKLTALLKKEIAKVSGVSDVEITNLKKTAGDPAATTVAQNDKFSFDWSLTYNGNLVSSTGAEANISAS